MATLLAHKLPANPQNLTCVLPVGAFSSGMLTRVPRPALAPTLNSLLFLGGFLAASSQGANLEWKNGEVVGGGIVSGTDKELVWRVDPPRFGEPLELRLEVLRSIDLKPDANKDWSKDESTQEPLSIRLDDGSRLFGTITGFDAKNVTVKAARFGTVAVARSAVTSVQRLNGDGILMAGPAGRASWKPDDPKWKHLWRHVPGGYISQIGWNHAARVEMKLPERVELRLRLRSQQRPDFKLELASEEKQRCVIETWDNEIVLQGREFNVLNTLADDQRSVTLGLFWDRKTGLCSLMDGSGKKLAETKMPPVESKEAEKPEEVENRPPQVGGLLGAIAGLVQMKMANARPATPKTEIPLVPGLTLKNKGQDLTLDELLLREWNGKLPEEISDVVPRVELMDGRVLKGSIVKADAQTFTVEAGTRQTALPLEPARYRASGEGQPHRLVVQHATDRPELHRWHVGAWRPRFDDRWPRGAAHRLCREARDLPIKGRDAHRAACVTTGRHAKDAAAGSVRKIDRRWQNAPRYHAGRWRPDAALEADWSLEVRLRAADEGSGNQPHRLPRGDLAC